MAVHKIDRYEVKAELGRGGMATVYRAYDPRFKRTVAVKVLPREFLHDPNFRARFEREAETIAKLEHAAIVPVYDYGEEDGQPYLVMRFMGGGSLAERVEEGPLAVGEVTTILARLAPALDKAHRQGIIHRDLKPGNVLFDEDGNAYLSDFGIVKIAQSTSAITESGGVVGTPAYMAPEQVHGETPVDFRADLYALGVIVYEMLAGRKPYDADTPPRLMMKHVMDPIPDVGKARRDLDAAWDTVIQQAMAKNPEARFQSARDLAKAATSAAGEPTPTGLETPTPTRRRASGTGRSVTTPVLQVNPRRVVVRSAILVGLAVILLAGVILGSILTLQGLAQGVSPVTVEQERTLSVTDQGTLRAIALSPDGRTLAGAYGHAVVMWYAERGIRARTVEFDLLTAMAYSPDGSMLALVDSSQLGLYDADTLEQLRTFERTDIIALTSVAFSPDSTLIAMGIAANNVAAVEPIRVFSVTTGAELLRLEGHQGGVNDIAFSPDGTLLASASDDSTVIIWDSDTGERLRTIHGHTSDVTDVEFSPDGTQLATSSDDRSVVIWDAATGERIRTFDMGNSYGNSLAYSPDGALLAVGLGDGRVSLWDSRTGESLATLTGHERSIIKVIFSPDGMRLVSASFDGTIILWRIEVSGG